MITDLISKEILQLLPLWVLIIIVLLWAFNKFLPEILKSGNSLGFTKKDLEQCKALLMSHEQKLKDMEELIEKERAILEDTRKDYYKLMGAFSIIRSKLKESGFDDIPLDE